MSLPQANAELAAVVEAKLRAMLKRAMDALEEIGFGNPCICRKYDCSCAVDLYADGFCAQCGTRWDSTALMQSESASLRNEPAELRKCGKETR